MVILIFFDVSKISNSTISHSSEKCATITQSNNSNEISPKMSTCSLFINDFIENSARTQNNIYFEPKQKRKTQFFCSKAEVILSTVMLLIYWVAAQKR